MLYVPAQEVKTGLVVACGLNYEIGQNGTMPWYIPGDLQFFKQQTLSSCVIMGRKTFASIGRPLPKRRNIVITSDPDFSQKYQVESCRSPQEALELAKNQTQVGDDQEIFRYDKIFIIGGAQLFTAALEYVDLVMLTKIFASFPQSDTFLQALDSQLANFELIDSAPQKANQFFFTLKDQPQGFQQEILKVKPDSLVLNPLEKEQNDLSLDGFTQVKHSLEQNFKALAYQHLIFKRV